jgi:hypothetical protein
MAVSIVDRYRWKVGIDGRSVAMEDRYRWRIGSDGRPVAMESVTKTPDTGSIKRIVNRMGSEDLLVERWKGLFQSEQELEEWGFQDKEYNGHR